MKPTRILAIFVLAAVLSTYMGLTAFAFSTCVGQGSTCTEKAKSTSGSSGDTGDTGSGGSGANSGDAGSGG
jgi:hypothetical protein